MSKLNYTGYIYKIENLINNHSYIGKTNNPRRRWNEHIREHSTCSILKKAFRKYGINNFKMVILLEIKASSISNCLNKKSKSAGNFKWVFKERSNYE